MNKKNLYAGIGIGLAAWGCAALIMKPRKKKHVSSAVGTALKTMGEMADSISDSMGW